MDLTHDNYYSIEASTAYFSASQYKEFRECPARVMARLRGEISDEPTPPMLRGSYVDAYFTADLEQFKAEHPEIYLKDGKTLKADYRTCEKMIERAEKDSFFMSFLEGKPQEILTGEIAGVPFKGMIDIFNPLEGRIVDLKTTASFRKIWSDKARSYVGFITAYDYVTQGAVYRELVRQQYGQEYDFYIAAITAETEPDIAIFSIPEETLDNALMVLEDQIGGLSAIKEGFLEAPRCERCDYCKRTKKLKEAIDLRDYDWR